MDSDLRGQVEQIRPRLVSIIETVILCSRQEIALDDAGPLYELIKNDCDFPANLRMRMRCDTTLKHHMESAPQNALYVISQIQNEIISACGSIKQETVVRKVN